MSLRKEKISIPYFRIRHWFRHPRAPNVPTQIQFFSSLRRSAKLAVYPSYDKQNTKVKFRYSDNNFTRRNDNAVSDPKSYDEVRLYQDWR